MSKLQEIDKLLNDDINLENYINEIDTIKFTRTNSI